MVWYGMVILFRFPRDCECTVSQQLQETFEYCTTKGDGFLHGLLVRTAWLLTLICMFGWIDLMLYNWSSHTQ